MRLSTCQQAIEIDELSSKVYGLSPEVLMESAGALSSREIHQSFLPEITKGQISIVCGPGNNGGDALVVARHLHSMGHRQIEVFVASDKKKRSKLYHLQLQRCELAGIKIFDLVESPALIEKLNSSQLIVDGVFGIGFRPKMDKLYLNLVTKMNSVGVPIVSLDVPSGLDANRGKFDGNVIRASMTLTYGLSKPGFYISEGPLCVGKLRVLSIGFPFECLRGVATSHFCFTEKLARRYLPKRRADSNKSDHGRTVIVAGSEGMWGAGVLAASAAYRMGAGYVSCAGLGTPTFLKDVPEVLSVDLSDKSQWEKILSSDSVAVGPGLGLSPESKKITYELISELISAEHPKVVLDADALSVVREFDLFSLPPSWIVTPHSGELGRILDLDPREIEKDRFLSLSKASLLMGCHVLLKGFRSILCHSDRFMIINSGNSALAKAGTGDVLTGMIASLLAQGLEPLQATCTASYIHGRLADEWVRDGHDKRALVASDLGRLMPELLQRISRNVLF